MPRLLASALVAAALVAAGCGSGDEEGSAELRIYLSAPLSGPSARDGRDVADGAELALADADGQAAGVEITLEVLDDADEDGWDAALSGENARTAIRDSASIAYIGELESGATRTSLPITNEAELLQVSPGSSATDLTEAAIGSTQVPLEAQPSGSRTFGRVIPSDFAQGEAGGVAMAGEGVESVAIEDASGRFDESLVAGIESVAGSPAIAPEADADATYIARESLVSARSNVVPAGARPIFGSDALLAPDELTSLRILTEGCRTRTDCPAEPRDILLTSAALDPRQLPAAADDFLAAFREATGRGPGPYAAYGYEAMAVVLNSIERAEDPLDRGSVLEAFFATADRESIIGTYSIDDVGDTTLGTLGSYRVAGGRPVPAEVIEVP